MEPPVGVIRFTRGLVMFFRTYRLLFPVIVLILAVISCKDEEKGIPPVMLLPVDPGFVSDGDLVSPGTSMSFKIKMSAGSEMLTNFYIEMTGSGNETVRRFDTAMYTERLTWTGSFHKSSEPTETWTFMVRDRRGGSSRMQLTVLADTGTSYGPVKLLENIRLGAQNNPSYGGFYSLSLEKSCDVEEAMQIQGSIDMTCYFGPDGRTLASPGANIEDGIYPDNLSPVNWQIRNTTRYIKTSLAKDDFDGVSSDSLMIALYVDVEGKRKAKQLTVGDVYVFKNQQGRLGLFYLNAATGSQDAVIDMDVKIQIEEK